MAIFVKSLKKVKFDLGDLDLWPWPPKNYTDRSWPKVHILTNFGDDRFNIFWVIAITTNRQTNRQTNEQINILGKIYDFCQVMKNRSENEHLAKICMLSRGRDPQELPFALYLTILPQKLTELFEFERLQCWENFSLDQISGNSNSHISVITGTMIPNKSISSSAQCSLPQSNIKRTVKPV